MGQWKADRRECEHEKLRYLPHTVPKTMRPYVLFCLCPIRAHGSMKKTNLREPV